MLNVISIQFEYLMNSFCIQILEFIDEKDGMLSK